MYEIFQKLLDSKGITAYKVAKATGITTSTLTQWKKGTSTPKTNKMQKIANYFGVSIEYLTTGVDSEENMGTKERGSKNDTIDTTNKLGSYKLFQQLLAESSKKASDVSKATDIPSSMFSEWKRGKSCPKIDKLQKIAEYFGVNVEYFTGKKPTTRTQCLNEIKAPYLTLAKEIQDRNIPPEDIRLAMDFIERLKN